MGRRNGGRIIVLDGRTITSLLISTILFGGVALFGKLIPLPPYFICLGRAIFGAAALALVLVIRRKPLFPLHKRSDIISLLVPGLLLSGNWFFYFLSIQTSTVAIGVISLFTYPFITALIEPFIFKEKHQPVDIIGACVVLAGIALIVPRFDISGSIIQGIFFGVISGLCFSLSSIASRRMVSRYSATTVMWYQFLTIAVIFSPVLFIKQPVITATLIGQFVILGSILTALAQVLFIASLRKVTTSIAAIFGSSQPLFAILFASIIIKEIPSLRTILGGLIVCTAVTVTALWHAREKKPETTAAI